MPLIDQRPLRLIDALNNINHGDYVSIVSNNGRTEYWNTVRNAKIDFKKWHKTMVKSTEVLGGNVRIFI